VDDFVLTFEQDLRQISGRAVFASPSNYRTHWYNIPRLVQVCCTAAAKTGTHETKRDGKQALIND